MLEIFPQERFGIILDHMCTSMILNSKDHSVNILLMVLLTE